MKLYDKIWHLIGKVFWRINWMKTGDNRKITNWRTIGTAENYKKFDVTKRVVCPPPYCTYFLAW